MDFIGKPMYETDQDFDFWFVTVQIQPCKFEPLE